MMMFWMAVRLALRSLVRNKVRAMLTVLGILMGVASVVASSAIGAGAKERIESQFASLGVNVLMVWPGASATGGARGAAGSASGLTEDDALALSREVPSLSASAPILSASTQVVSGSRNWSTRVYGSTLDYFRVRAWRTSDGGLFTDADVRTSAKVCVIGETVRRELFGDESALGRTMRVGRMPCTVLGVMESKGQSGFGQDQDDLVIVPLSTFRTRVSHRPGREIGFVMASARDPALMSRAEEGITRLLRQRHRLSGTDESDFTVRNMADVIKSFDEQRAAISLLLLVVASISLLVGGIGVMNIMLVSVTERTREIGIRLSIGARSRDILAQFLIEAVVLASVGGVAGLALGIGASLIVGMTTSWTVKVQPETAILAVAVAGGIGVIFGFFPARRAAKMDPITALRHE
ncbi:MAG: ABC transporter permease [Deltaproteobacteria bacterium]|nr:ABC transporter permease [Deltaproteobacteria bacterium]